MIRRHASRLILGTVLVGMFGCASILHVKHADQILKVSEYDQKVKVTPAEAAPKVEAKKPEESKKAATSRRHARSRAVHRRKTKKHMDKRRVSQQKKSVSETPVHMPELEDSHGFIGRRPIKDPFRVGEKAVFNLSYFNIVAGTMAVEVKPFVDVNGVKAYQFVVTAKSNSFFSHIYSVDDSAITYVSFEDLVPLSLVISIKESKQLAEARTFFDWKNNTASYWRKKITKEHGEENKKLDWKVEPYAQNVISAAYYLRTFHLVPGKDLAFRVADEGKNLVFTGQVLRREKLETAIGTLNTVVIKPKVTVGGVFKPVGDILIWLTDDDRKFIVRMESKIRIGSIVAKLKSLDKGRD